MTDEGRRLGLFAFLEEAEQTLPVASWTIDGVRVWPLVRCYHTFELITRVEFRGNNQIARYSGTRGRLRQIVTALFRAQAVRHRDRAGNDRLRPADVAILANSTTRFFQVNGAWYNPYADSFQPLLTEAGVSSLVLEVTPDGEYRAPRFAPSLLIQDRLFLRSLYARLVTGRRRHQERLDGWDAMLRLHDRLVGRGLRPCLASLRFRAAQVRAFAAFFRGLLRTIRPRVVLTSGYYSTDAMALNLVAREFGAAAVEVQHGVQGAAHFAYRRWHDVPLGGYELLPQVFWCWGSLEAETIAGWTGPGANAHRALVGGNPCLEIVDRDGAPLSQALAGRIADRRGSHTGMQVLYTVQAFYELPVGVVEAMQDTPDWTWWVRVHPQYWETREPIRRILREHGLDNWIIEEASDYPLVSLLELVHVHVTEFSSSVLEAEALGVPSVVVDPRGRELYSAQIAAGTVRYADSGAALRGAVEALAAARGRRLSDHTARFRDGVRALVQIVATRP